MAGGYKHGSGRSKSGYYKGIYCGSTYELCWVIHALDHKIKFTRFDKRLEKDGVVYYPDFLLEDGVTIIEPKGYEKEVSVSKKTALAESLGYIVKVMRKDDLKYAFDYVEKTYGTKKFYNLYDDYKPKYSYVCAHCGNQFNSDKKSKYEKVFCNRICAINNINKKNEFKNNKRKVSSNSGWFKEKLTKEQALEIFNNNKLTLNELENKFNINKSSIVAIRSKKIYKWIHEENLNIEKRLLGGSKTYKKENRKKLIQNFISENLNKKIVFKSFNELAILVSTMLSKKEQKKCSRQTLFKNIEYRNLLEEYFSEQSKF